MNHDDAGELLARLDERTAHLVTSVDWIRDQMATKAEVQAVVAPLAKDVAEFKAETGHRMDKLEHRQDDDHKRIIWTGFAVVVVLAVALGVPKLAGWLGAILTGG